jgi:class 3 adenylate cyclase/tetratricopeptide (TPR) repeat protein
LLLLLAQANGTCCALLSDQAGVALFATLSAQSKQLPDEFLAALRRGSPKLLRLQMSASLDGLQSPEWEASIAMCCPDCACSRSLVFGQVHVGEVQLPDLLSPGLRWARQRPTDATLYAMQEQGEALLLWPKESSAIDQSQGLNWQALRATWQTGEWLSQALRRLLRRETSAHWPRLYGDLLGHAAGVAAADQGLRWVSTLSVDLVGSTRLSGSLAAEDYAQLVCRYHEVCRTVVTSLGGSIDPPQGDDGLMCYFGFPRALEDAPARAVLAAQELSQRLLALGLPARCGVTSGRVAVAAMQAFGLSINLAAKLQKLAPVGSVFVAEVTVNLLGSRILGERVRPDVNVEGVTEPVAVYRLLHCEARVSAPASVGVMPFVGREVALARLQQVWREAAQGNVRAVLVESEAGMGKSRLLREFRWRAGLSVQRLFLIEGNEQARANPFRVLSDGLRVAMRLPAGIKPARLRDRLSRRLRGWPEGHGETLDLLTQLLSPAVERDQPRDASWQQRCLSSLISLAKHALGLGPWCLLVDDLQWLDPSTVELLDRLVECSAGFPLLLVAAQRIEPGMERRLRQFEAIHLDGLMPEESLTLLRALNAAKPLGEQRLRELMEQADGVPLYLEEGLAHAQHNAAAAPSPVPQRLEDRLAHQLERLQDGRALAELAAVLGREFPLALWDRLVQLEEPDAQQHAVEQLLSSGLLEWRAGDPPRLRFRHGLLRDAAYASRWLSERQRLHARVANLLEESFADAAWFRAEDLAEHWAQAGQHAQALQVLAPVARNAAARGAHREALALCERALRWIDALATGEVKRRWILSWQLQRASNLIALHGYGAPSVEAAYLEAEEQAPDDASTRARVRLGLEACYVMRGDLVRARQLAEQLVAEQPWSGDRLLALQSRWALANVCVHQGDADLAMEMADDCLSHYEPSLHRPSSVQNPAIMCLCYSAWTAFELGRADEAMVRQRRLLALAEQLQHPFSSAVAQGFAASVELFCGRFENARVHAQSAIAGCDEGGFTVWRAHALVMRGRARCRLGEPDAGLADLQRGLDEWSASGAVVTHATYLGLFAQSLLEQGQTQAATEQIDLALSIADRHGETYFRAELLRLRALCAWQSGNLIEAENGLQHALQQATQQARGAYQLRARLGLALLHPDDARMTALRAFFKAFPGHQDTRDAEQARAVLEAWSQGDALTHRHHCPWDWPCKELAETHSISTDLTTNA